MIGAALAFGVNYRNKQNGLKGISNKDLLNPLKWGSVLYGFGLKLLVPPHVLEQMAIRLYEEDCAVCVKEGVCVGGTSCGNACACGCDTIAKMYSPFEEDSGENWNKIIFNKQKYKSHREEYPVKIKIHYGSE